MGGGGGVVNKDKKNILHRKNHHAWDRQPETIIIEGEGGMEADDHPGPKKKKVAHKKVKLTVRTETSNPSALLVPQDHSKDTVQREETEKEKKGQKRGTHPQGGGP